MTLNTDKKIKKYIYKHIHVYPAITGGNGHRLKVTSLVCLSQSIHTIKITNDLARLQMVMPRTCTSPACSTL